MFLQKEKIVERGRTKLFCMEDSLWKRLWTIRNTDWHRV